MSINLDISKVVPIRYYRGNTFNLSFCAKVDGQPEDYTGSTFAFKVADGNGNVLVNLISGNGITVTDKVYIKKSRDEMAAAVPVGNYTYRLEQIYPNQDQYERLRGGFTAV